jgi:hypothetical protein
MMKVPRIQSLIEFLLDNLFDIATLIVASALVIWYQIHPPSASDVAEIATWILAVLALIAISGLWERNRKLSRIEKLSEEGRNLAQRYLSRKVYASDFFLSERPLSEKDFSSAHTVYLVGLTLARTSREFLYVLGQRLVAGATIRFIIIDPESEAVLQEIASRSFEAPSKYWRDTLKSVETVIEALAKTPNGQGTLEVGYLPFVPAFGLIIIEPHQTHGKCVVELYQHKSAAPHATFELQASEDQYWYKYFVDQFDILWSSCRIKPFKIQQ